MFIFIRLVLAHLIGDFPLQTEKIFRLKQKGGIWVVPHVLIVTSCFILLSFPYLHLPQMWAFIGFTFIIHLFQDILKLKLSQSPRYALLWYLIDQVFHILGITVIFFTSLQFLQPPVESQNAIIALYNNDTFIYYCIALILASYNGHWILFLLRAFYLNRTEAFSPFEKYYGIVERGLILTCFFAGSTYLYLIPFAAILRPIIASIGKDRLTIDKHFGSITEILLSSYISILTGVIFFIIL